MDKNTLHFPKNFLWGTATSAYQVEGDNKFTDWWSWEKTRQQIEDSGKTTDHYRLYKKDIGLVKNYLHNNAFRLSIEWARIEPKRGEINKKEISHYKNVLTELKRNKIKTFVTLHHFTSPEWFTKSGSWLSKDNTLRFKNFAWLCADNFGELVNFWSTFNEPSIYTSASFLYGYWPPLKRGVINFVKAYRQLAQVHNEVYTILHKTLHSPQVGPVVNLLAFKEGGFWDKPLLPLGKWVYNDWFLQMTKGHFDYLGINYYTQHTVKWKNLFKKRMTYSELMGMYTGHDKDIARGTYPQGIYEVTKSAWRKYKKPIYITENGCFGKNDSLRQKFILNHLTWLHKAIEERVDIRGYFYWSLLDNFEWHFGRGIKYGLFETDYKTFKRTPRESANLYTQIAKNNGITE